MNLITQTVTALRKSFCCIIGLLLIATGRVRMARRRAFSGEVVTAIYFHEPNRKLFTQCIQWLVGMGYTFISLDQLVELLRKGPPFPRGKVWISLDDGYRNWLTNVLPVARKYGVPVTLFIPSGIVAGAGLFPWLHDTNYPSNTNDFLKNVRGKDVVRESLTVGEVKRIAADPEVTFGSHTVSHAITTVCSTVEELRVEIGSDKRTLEKWTGRAVESFAYPCGVFSGQEKQLLKDLHFTIAATTEPKFIDAGSDPLLLPRFCVPDKASAQEAICAMVGVWRPLIDSIKSIAWTVAAVAPEGLLKAGYRITGSKTGTRWDTALNSAKR
jgi:peptidoglycan/xylan/chitin deacetylase (PgdA/CDA1 family)